MSRPGHLVAAEHEARDEALRRMEDSTDGRDEAPWTPANVQHECDGSCVWCVYDREKGWRWGR